MDQILNDPIISHFFQSVKENEKKSALRQLILLGIHAVSSKIHEGKCECGKEPPTCLKNNKYEQSYVPYQFGPQSSTNQTNNNIAVQIQNLKKRINQLSACLTNNQKNPITAHFNDFPEKNIKVAQTQGLQTVYEGDPSVQKKNFRHHLDDSEVRKALINPYAKPSPPRKPKKETIQKLHKFQKERDAEELRALKDRNQLAQNTGQHQQGDQQRINEAQNNLKSSGLAKTEKNSYKFKNAGHQRNTALQTIGENEGRAQKQGNSNKKQNKNKTVVEARSKIKSLIEKDKQKNKKIAFIKRSNEKKEKYCQFQYSDQEYINQDSHYQNVQNFCPVHEEPSKNSQSEQFEDQSFKKVYKQTKRRIKEQALEEQSSFEEYERGSESSSFSKFSMSSRREAGKISGHRK